MDLKTARLWLVHASLSSLSGLFVFCVVAPFVPGSALDMEDSIRLMQVIGPVFCGYLGTAVRFMFSSAPETRIRAGAEELFPVLVRAPVILFSLGMIVTLGAFIASNYPTAGEYEVMRDNGMRPDQLMMITSALLAFLGVTTSLLTPYLFPVSDTTSRLEPR